MELVLVAGDVFDTYLPSSEAEDLFYTSVRELAGKDRAVVIISGNHDDHIRLAAATSLSEEFGIYIYGNVSHVPALSAVRKTHPVRAGRAFYGNGKRGGRTRVSQFTAVSHGSAPKRG